VSSSLFSPPDNDELQPEDVDAIRWARVLKLFIAAASFEVNEGIREDIEYYVNNETEPGEPGCRAGSQP
jgi:hypothetical protein